MKFKIAPSVTAFETSDAAKSRTRMLNGMAAAGKQPVYLGTVSEATVATRRRRNKAARIARRANR